ncbi:OmpA family protein [Lysobacter sp. S4-A87]|uniref:OmpA family protein n=1 Tax=Lysobacter sp. S4-A87 TaxID=2925843 RepID=UPI001F52EFFF|nr:OmpA family protein [Lysobacter sp. S4-A87]UNK49462.1 OmpA family protein [Lysobacter sp. S4-A87]
MFSQILEQVTHRFGLDPDQAKRLMGLLVAQVFNPRHGGPAGFIQSFRNQGLGELMDSWLGPGPNQPITPAQLAGVLGNDTLASFGTRLGLSEATVGSAAAAMLPDAIDELSEHGDLPVSPSPLSQKLEHWFGGIGVGLDEFGQWATATGAVAAAAPVHAEVQVHAHATAPAQAPSHQRSSTHRWLPWLLIGAVIIIAVLLPRGCHGERTAVTGTQPLTSKADAATRALDLLISRTFTADDLVHALNLMVVHFDSDSENISAQSDAILVKAATAIKAAPAGTRIEIGGHTDNSGDPAANLKLSQARADAVKQRLIEHGADAAMLTSIGHGQDQPVADNASEEGRARNRRIQFSVVK